MVHLLYSYPVTRYPTQQLAPGKELRGNEKLVYVLVGLGTGEEQNT